MSCGKCQKPKKINLREEILIGDVKCTFCKILMPANSQRVFIRILPKGKHYHFCSRDHHDAWEYQINKPDDYEETFFPPMFEISPEARP